MKTATNDENKDVNIGNSVNNHNVNIDNFVKTNDVNMENLSTVSDKKIESINSLTININDPTTGNRLTEMETLSSVINLLACPSCGKVTMEVSVVDSKRKGLSSFYWFSEADVLIFLNRILHAQLTTLLV